MKESTAKLAEAIGEIHDRYITEAESYHTSRRARFMRWSALAASCLLTVGVVLAVALTLPRDPGFPGDRPAPDTEPLPSYDGAYLSAEQIEDSVFNLAFKDSVNGATNAYTTVCAPAAAALNLSPLPSEEYATIWRYQPKTKALDGDELRDDISTIYPRLAAMLGVTIPEPDYDTDREDGTVTAAYAWDSIRYNIRATQLSGRGRYSTSDARTVISVSGKHWDTVDICGTPIEVDQRLSDEAILASLTDIRDALFDAFGQSFGEARVERTYGSYHEEGVERLTVIYSDATDLPETGDSLQISFDNVQNFSDDTVSATVLRNCTITYTRHRVPLANAYTPEANCRLLSLAEAEVLLRAGYVFGGHSCPLCMEMQTPVSFDEYDLVTVEYRTGDPTETGTALSVPFYAFYKDIGASENGNRTYAKTLVPAVAVSGLEGYFEGQRENHNRGTAYEEVLPD